jgi:outer membrane protein assembly factor BamA
MRNAFRMVCALALVAGGIGRAGGQSTLADNTLIYSTSQKVTLPDSNSLYIIRDIAITGNAKTKPDIILREVPLQVDGRYTLAQIVDQFQITKQQLMNTTLFRNVVVSLKSLQGYNAYISIDVEERWYVYPIPFVRAVDKSFHQWWSETDRSMNRVNYGVRVSHKNFTGRNDQLNLRYMNGYTKQVAVEYHGLFLDRQLKWSTSAGFEYGKNKEVNYITLDDKRVPIKDNDKFLRSYVHSFVELSYRPAIKTRHTFNLSFNYENVDDTIYKLNPAFSDHHNNIHYPELSYRMTYFDVDFIPYPTKGYAAEITLRRAGFYHPVNLWQATVKGSATWPVGDRYFFNLRGVGTVKLPFKQPYISKRFLENGDQYMQGYEYYAIDGVAGGYAKAILSRPILNTFISIPSQRFKRLNHIPLKLYAKAFVNTGYVYDPEPGHNEFSNRMLYSGGIGLDIVTLTDFVIKIEWSFNHLGENGLYLHRREYF